MLINLVNAEVEEFDYVIGQEYAQDNTNTDHLWIEGSNGLIQESGGQTFTAPYSINITGFKFKASAIQNANGNITTYIATVKEDHTPNISTLVAEIPIVTFSTGWNTWTFDKHYELTEGIEYAIWWGGDVLGGAGTNGVRVYLTNTSIYDFDGGELFLPKDGSWAYAGDNDFVMNLTFYGCPEEWQPLYTPCTIGDNHTLYYNDTNECGTTNDLPLDNSTTVLCNYCSLDYTLQDTTCQSNHLITTYAIYDNFETCCNVTGLSADCDLPANTSVACVGAYESSDIDNVVIDNLVEFGIEFKRFVPLLILLLFAWLLTRNEN